MENIKDFLEEKYEEKLTQTEIDTYKKRLSDFMELLIEIDKGRLN